MQPRYDFYLLRVDGQEGEVRLQLMSVTALHQSSVLLTVSRIKFVKQWSG